MDQTNKELKRSFAWFSEEAAKFSGTSYYRLLDGKIVEVTSVTETEDCYQWPDKKFLGYVSTDITESFVRVGKAKSKDY